MSGIWHTRSLFHAVSQHTPSLFYFSRKSPKLRVIYFPFKKNWGHFHPPSFSFPWEKFKPHLIHFYSNPLNFFWYKKDPCLFSTTFLDILKCSFLFNLWKLCPGFFSSGPDSIFKEEKIFSLSANCTQKRQKILPTIIFFLPMGP